MQKQLLATTKGRLKTIMKKSKDQKNRRTLRTKTMRKAYAKATRSISTGVAAIMLISLPHIHSIVTAFGGFEPISSSYPVNSENQESIDVEIQDMTQPTTTTVVTTSISTTTTTVTTTTLITTTEEVVKDSAEDETETEEYYEYEEEEEVYDDSEEYYEEPNNQVYSGSFEATYYPGEWGTCGYVDGEGYVQLTPGYSIASSYFPKGSIVYISGGGLDGYYRVEDYCPSGDHVIDFFYTYDTIPADFAYYGRFDVDAYLVE